VKIGSGCFPDVKCGNDVQNGVDSHSMGAFHPTSSRCATHVHSSRGAAFCAESARTHAKPAPAVATVATDGDAAAVAAALVVPAGEAATVGSTASPSMTASCVSQ